jgi:hypothetical protein
VARGVKEKDVKQMGKKQGLGVYVYILFRSLSGLQSYNKSHGNLL